MPYRALNADERGDSSPSGKPSLTVAEAAAQLTRAGLSWSGALGEPATVTYAFRINAPATMPEGTSGFGGFAGQSITMAETAMQFWSEVANIKFVRVGSGLYGDQAYSSDATILFGTFSQGPAGLAGLASLPGDRASASSAGDVWIASNVAGGTPGSWQFTAMLHEIGHAIGLLHPGEYDGGSGTPSYATAAAYAEDSLEYTVMSYFGLEDTGGRITYPDMMPGAPLIDDVAAIQRLYGPNSSTRSGPNVYGSNAYSAFFDGEWNRNDWMPAGNGAGPNGPLWMNIWDAGGVDTLDFAGTPYAQRLDLHAGSFSDVQGGIGTLSISVGVTIENAVGGILADSITGNEANNTLVGGQGADTFTGAGGNDTYLDIASDHNGDTITDFSPGDSIIFADAGGGFTYSIAGTTLTYTGGTMTLGGDLQGSWSLTPYKEGGVQLTLHAGAAPSTPLPPDAKHDDFNGDGRSDILWRSTDGYFSDWLATANGGFSANDVNAMKWVPNDWVIAGTGDFNGDNRADVLWRGVDGSLSDWLGTANGGFASNDARAFTRVGTDWSVVGTGDFNGDGRDDVLWRNSDGRLSNWLANESGGFASNDANALTRVSTDWKVAGTGDFNGDGKDDILWRNDDGRLSDWLGKMGGGFVSNDAAALTRVSTTWTIAGTGDFNGDGRDDIVWRNADGAVSDWLSTAAGGFAANDANAFTRAPTSWQIVATGDYNGDGKDDLLWRNSDGALSNWLGNAAGGFASNDANALTSAPNSWHVQPEPFAFG